MGDFNIKMSNLDTTNTSFSNTRASSKLGDILDEFSLEDSWRFKHPTSRQYTWRRANPIQQSRIDFIFTSGNILHNNLVHSKIEAGILSDHSLVVTCVDISNDRRGPGIWRYNNRLLCDADHINNVRREIRAAKNHIDVYRDVNDKGILVELMLSNIRVLTIKRTKKLAFELRKEENELYQNLNELEIVVAADASPTQIAKYNTVRKKLNELKESRGKAAIARSQLNWTELGEKPSSYFFKYEKTRASNKLISTLQTNNGNIIRMSCPIINL